MTLRRWRTFETADAVCEAERTRPDIGQRLRTSHDYLTNPDQVTPANPELVRALEAETQERVTREPIEPLGRPWPIFVLLGSCLALVLIWLATFAALPEWRVATARLLFVPVHYSEIHPQPLPETIHQGEDIVVRLHVDGRPLKTARVLYRDTDESEWNEVSLQPATDGALVDDLSAVGPDCRSDLEIQIEAGNFNSGVHLVAVRMPLVLEEWNAKMQPPAYTGLWDDPEHPQSMDYVSELLGAEAVAWSYGVDCCGGSLTLNRSDVVVHLVDKLARAAREAGAEALVTACPMCMANVDGRQKYRGGPPLPRPPKPDYEPLPIFYFTELMALAYGLPSGKALGKHLVDPRPLLKRLELV